MRGAGLCFVPLLLAGCLSNQFNLATQREEYVITSTEKEVKVGRRIAQQVKRELPEADEPLQQRVREIGANIAAVCDRRELVYTFTVVEEEELNAFSLPGGYVFVNDGLIKKTDSDDELAGVIAHEVAHITARHAMKRYEGSLGAQLAALAAVAARDGRAARGVSTALRAARLSYARQDELEADRLAVKYLKAAGYKPEALLTFMETLRKDRRGKTTYMPRGVVRPHYAMTHPMVAERVRTVKEAIYGVADYIDYLNTPR